MFDPLAGNFKYRPLKGKIVAITAASVEQTALVGGVTYEFTAFGGVALCRWDTTAATIADDGFTFAVAPGSPVRIQNPDGNTLLNVIEGSADSGGAAVLTICEVMPK